MLFAERERRDVLQVPVGIQENIRAAILPEPGHRAMHARLRATQRGAGQP